MTLRLKGRERWGCNISSLAPFIAMRFMAKGVTDLRSSMIRHHPSLTRSLADIQPHALTNVTTILGGIQVSYRRIIRLEETGYRKSCCSEKRRLDEIAVGALQKVRRP